MDLFGDFGGILAMDLVLSGLVWGKSGWLPPTFRFTGGIFHRIFLNSMATSLTSKTYPPVNLIAMEILSVSETWSTNRGRCENRKKTGWWCNNTSWRIWVRQLGWWFPRYGISGWWSIYLPLWKMMEWKSIGRMINHLLPHIFELENHPAMVWNHQPEYVSGKLSMHMINISTSQLFPWLCVGWNAWSSHLCDDISIYMVIVI